MVRGCPLELPDSGDRGLQAWDWGWWFGCKGLCSPNRVHLGLPYLLMASAPTWSSARLGPRAAGQPRHRTPLSTTTYAFIQPFAEMHDLCLPVRKVT